MAVLSHTHQPLWLSQQSWVSRGCARLRKLSAESMLGEMWEEIWPGRSQGEMWGEIWPGRSQGGRVVRSAVGLEGDSLLLIGFDPLKQFGVVTHS